MYLETICVAVIALEVAALLGVTFYEPIDERPTAHFGPFSSDS